MNLRSGKSGKSGKSGNQGISFAVATLLVLGTILAGCSSFKPAFEHRTRVEDYAGRFLSTRTAAGDEWLKVEARQDETVRGFVRAEGRPDYLYVVDAQRLHIFYPARDLAATFERGLFGTKSEVTRHRPIPRELARLLPASARQTIAAARRSRRR